MDKRQVINHSQGMNQSQLLSQSQLINHLGQSQMVVNQPPTPLLAGPGQPQMVGQLNQPPQLLNPIINQAQMAAQSPSLVNQPNLISPGYGDWAQKHSSMPPMNNLIFPNQIYGAAKPRGRGNWKGKKVMDNRKDGRRKDKPVTAGSNTVGVGGPISGGGGYNPPTLKELEHQNRLKAKRFYHKKKFNRMGPYAHAPRNTTSYIIRAKKSGGIASLVSPCPVTPAVLPTPVFSPSREALVDMAKEEWGVDGYGSMKGLIRLRSSPGHEAEIEDYAEEDDGESSESDVEEHLEVERRLDNVSSRFEMVYPNYGSDHHNVLENRVDDQDTHIATLEEENLLLKERLYLMERELAEFRRRLQFLERQNQVVEDINEEVIENVSENDSEGTRDAHLRDENHNEEEYPHKFEQNTDVEAKDEELDHGMMLGGQNLGNQGICPSVKAVENELESLDDVKMGVDDDKTSLEKYCGADGAEKLTSIALKDEEDMVARGGDEGTAFGAGIAVKDVVVKTELTGDIAMDESAQENAKK